MNRLEQVQALFCDALLHPTEQRWKWVDENCPEASIREEVAALLRAHERMHRAAKVPDESVPGVPAFSVPTAAFGAYRAVDLLGRGGMSVVYRAERADGQFDQTVALKVMAAYLASPEFLRRFETERRLLASLHHPNIAHLLDGGVSSAGDPFLVTEYVDGDPIDRHCDRQKLDVEARLRVFLQVCDAVDYAHRNLIVHRDLKPANILVNRDGSVKLLDFGTASMVVQTDAPVTRLRMLTPRYASPEQLRGERATIATDVFSLGVILYELLTGAWPFGNPGSVLSELNRVANHATASPPATSITEATAESRSMPREQLGRMLRGDLGAIVLKALENDIARRYDSVREFAADVENFLKGRPVLARPQTLLYRAGKLVRRRWLPVSAAAVFVCGLVVATGVATYQARQARTQATRARRMASFANSLFLAPNAMWFNPQAGRGKDTRLVDVLESASRRMSTELKDDPLTELTLRTTLARTLMFLGMYERASQEAERAGAILPSVAGQAPDVEAELAVCRCDIFFGQTKYREAEPWCRQAVIAVRRLKASPNRLMIPAAGHLGVVLAGSGNRREAESLFHEALAAIPHPTGTDRNGVVNLRANFALAKMSWGEFGAAAEDYKSILADPAALTDTNGEFAMARANLATCYRALGDLRASEDELRAALQIAATHPIGNEARSWKIQVGLSTTLAMEGKLAEAESVLADIAPRIAKVSTGNTTLEGFFESASGICALARGQAAPAEIRFRRAVEVYRRTLQKDDPTLAVVSRQLAAALEAQDKLADAHAAAEEAVRIYAINYAPGNPVLEEARAYSNRFSN